MVPRCSSPRFPRPSAKRPEISGSVIDLSLSGSMRPLCIDAAHYATVDLLRPSADATSFQLIPFRSWCIFSFLLVRDAPF